MDQPVNRVEWSCAIIIRIGVLTVKVMPVSEGYPRYQDMAGQVYKPDNLQNKYISPLSYSTKLLLIEEASNCNFDQYLLIDLSIEFVG